MPGLEDLKTRAGRLLYRQLPEEYRFLDPRDGKELGDLEAYLHGFGHLLDLIRGTTEQAYADAFAEPVDFLSDRLGTARVIQGWLLPYLAELVGAELLAPDPAQRRRELAETVGWFKTKGTLRNSDSIADTLSGAETVTIEGWRRVITTPRLALPPFISPPGESPGEERFDASVPPLATPDLRRANRAILDPEGSNPLYRLVQPRRGDDGRLLDPLVTYWMPSAHGGAPCFPGAYDDTSARTPDLRDPLLTPTVGPHPRRVMLHVRPPFGFFEPSLREVALPAGSNPLKLDLSGGPIERLGPGEVLKRLGEPLDERGELVTPPPDKIVITGNLLVPAAARVEFEDLLFRDRLVLEPGSEEASVQVRLKRCAVGSLELPPGRDRPSVEAFDCLLGEIVSAAGFAQLVYCTLLSDTQLERLWASDCIFAGRLIDVKCSRGESCIRYSRVSDLAPLAGCAFQNSPHLVLEEPNFIRLYFKDAEGCRLRAARFGEPGAGVLDLSTSKAILAGAEDGGEMGAMHHLHHGARTAAVRRKLADFLPLGQQLAIRYDARLAHPPARVA